MKTREQVQAEALQILKDNNYTGTIVLATGTGKSKVVIDAILEGNFQNILITSPRTNLKTNWKKEFEKWGVYSKKDLVDASISSYIRLNGRKIMIENIQTVYKWNKDILQEFDLITIDEIHTIVTPEYGKLILNASKLNIPMIGLTGTPDDEKDEKAEFYADYVPILYRYLESSEHGIINKRKYILFNYPLTNEFKVQAGTKAKPFTKGEADQYEYLTEQIRKGQKLMAATGSRDWFQDAANWFWKNTGTPTQKNAARVYLQAIKFRKNFLWNLSSSAYYAEKFKQKILLNSLSDDREQENKILMFSELTAQANKLSPYTVHSGNTEEINAENLKRFDAGEIKCLASCNSLTLGLNLKNANWAIMESFNSSSVLFKQKAGRLDRLDPDDIANIIIIVPQQTQAETWINKALKGINRQYIHVITDITELNEFL